MSPLDLLIAGSLWGLTVILVGLTARGARQYVRRPTYASLAWTGGLALAAAAMAVEALVYAGIVDSQLLQAYVFLSAAIVGVLSLGALPVLQSARLRVAYSAYTIAFTSLVGAGCALTPLVPSAMVSGGVIVGNPPLDLLLLSSLVTGPATVVLLGSAVVSLRRSRRWSTMLMVAGALVLGAGGTLYIASFPVALYYAEFIGILLLFFGLVSLPRPSLALAGAPAEAHA